MPGCQFFFFFFFFPPSSPNQQLILGSDSAKIDFRKRVRVWKERERKTCGDFRNSSPKLFQMMLCCTLQNCSHTGCCSEGRQVRSSPRSCHTLSVIQAGRHRRTVNTVKHYSVVCLNGNIKHLFLIFPLPKILCLDVIREESPPRRLCNDAVPLLWVKSPASFMSSHTT